MSLVQERTRFTIRRQKVLEDTNIKLTLVASDIRRVLAQVILLAFLAGQENPKILAELAKEKLSCKGNRSS